jgi:cytochrome c oxidase cbb3-type subunit III
MAGPLTQPVKSLLVVALTAGLLVVAAIHWIHVRRDGARLLRLLPDEIPANRELNAFAMARGRAAFVGRCAPCHGIAGQPDASHGVPDLRDHDWLYGSGRIGELERVILYGIRAGNSKGWNLASMPAFGTPHPYSRYAIPSLTPQELVDVTEYVYSFQHADVDLGAVVRGKQVFEGQTRGLCWDCHGGLGTGDASIGAPNLRDATWLFGDGSRRSIYASIADGRAGSCPAWIGTLSPVTIVAVAVYTHSLSEAPRGGSGRAIRQ